MRWHQIYRAWQFSEVILTVFQYVDFAEDITTQFAYCRISAVVRVKAAQADPNIHRCHYWSETKNDKKFRAIIASYAVESLSQRLVDAQNSDTILSQLD